jgi:hypothetical protein
MESERQWGTLEQVALPESGEKMRIEIGFDGGQIMSALVSAEDADRLQRHLLAGGDGIVELEGEDGPCLVSVARIAYVKRFSREPKVGF